MRGNDDNASKLLDPLHRALYLTGPTASGKSAVSVALARRLDAEIVALDSMTLYRGMDIGTAKPTEVERGGVPHYLIDVLDPAAFTYTVAGTQRPPTLRIGTGDAGILYFSVVTLTTLGYGDIVPTSSISRMLVSVEAITGQLYLAVLVARLVGMHVVHAMNASGRESENREPNNG